MTLSKAVTIEIILLASLAVIILPGGQDLHLFYLPLARGCVECAYNPYHTALILFPLGWLPDVAAWPVWTFITLAGMAWSAQRLGVNPAILLLTFPVWGTVWLGQTDVLLVVGLALALTSSNPYVRGIGLTLLTVKPQVTGPVFWLLLWRDEDRLKAVIVPALVFGISLLIWGVDWPLRWLRFILENPLDPPWTLSTLFPYGLLAFGLLPLFKDKRQQALVTLLASAIGILRYTVYSYSVFLVLFAPWWSIPLSYAWALTVPFTGSLAQSLRYGYIMPIVILAVLVWPRLREWWQSRHSQWKVESEK
jgi:hypothetical protein